MHPKTKQKNFSSLKNEFQLLKQHYHHDGIVSSKWYVYDEQLEYIILHHRYPFYSKIVKTNKKYKS